MINRYYECDHCGHYFVTRQAMHDKLLKKCPKCKKNKLYQDLRGQYGSVKNVTTFGQLADKNTDQLGQYGKDKLEQERLETRKKVKLETLKRVGAVSPEASELPDKPKPWYNSEGKDLTKELKPIIGDKEKIKKYIMTGE